MKKVIVLLISVSVLTVLYSFISDDFSVDNTEPVIGTQIGNIAPEIDLLSPDGKSIKLSSLRGKMVLIDFWASWCGPCRYANPHVVKAYNKYKDTEFKNGKGFTVYSVSLDNNLQNWKNAIARDGLVWKNHVSDLKGWNSQAARLYNVRGIPATFLIDADGKILSATSGASNIEYELSKYIKK